MVSRLFTIVCEYAGGTYVSQVQARDAERALLEWAEVLRHEQPIDGASDAIVRAVIDDEEGVVPLTGLAGVWCWTEAAFGEPVMANIILSA